MRVLVFIHLSPRCAIVFRAPGTVYATAGLGQPQPCPPRGGGAAGIDEKDLARAAVFQHAAGERNVGPILTSIDALDERVHFVTGHDEMVRVIGIDNRRIVVLATRAAGSDEIESPVHAAIDGAPEAQAAAANAGF